IEDRRPIARPYIVALAIQGGRIVDLEEKLEQLPVTDARRIEDDLHRFGMSRMIAVGCVAIAATRVADPRRQDAVLLANQILHAPEAPASENRALFTHGFPRLYSRSVGIIAVAGMPREDPRPADRTVPKPRSGRLCRAACNRRAWDTLLRSNCAGP